MHRVVTLYQVKSIKVDIRTFNTNNEEEETQYNEEDFTATYTETNTD